MEIIIDLSTIQAVAAQNPLALSWYFFKSGGWSILVVFLLALLWYYWLNSRQNKYVSAWEYTLLAIDIPKDNEQSPKAVEQIFTHLEGTLNSPNFIEKYWHGKMQESFSFEVVSMDGYIQFLIRTVSHYRDLIEAAVYAQYPEAEITEVDDYTTIFGNLTFPSEDYDLWGTEFVLTEKEPYPIKTYPEFEHELSQEFKDPMAAILEIFSRLSVGEQVWLQLIVTPVSGDWKEEGLRIINKIMGRKTSGGNLLGGFFNEPIHFLEEGKNQILGFFGPTLEPPKKDSLPSLMQHLSPGERIAIEAIQNKVSKFGYKTKIRLIYLARHEVFAKARGAAAVTGALLQFNTSNLNGFKPHKYTKTKADYFWVNRRIQSRQNKIFKAYQKRSNYYGAGPGFILNTEELATIWHFPMMTVKAPMVKKIEARKAEPPAELPLEMPPTTPVETKPELSGTVSENII